MWVFRAYTSLYTLAHVVFEITVKSLVLAVVYFEISKLTSTMLGGKWSLLHIEVLVILLFLLRILIIGCYHP